MGNGSKDSAKSDAAGNDLSSLKVAPLGHTGALMFLKESKWGGGRALGGGGERMKL